MPSSFNGKHIVITGAASGIGKYCAQTLAAANATLFLIDIQKEALAQCAEEINVPRTTIHTLCCDLSRADSVAQMQTSLEVMPQIDILIHCAGLMGEFGRCHETTSQAYSMVMSHQFFTAVHSCQAILTRMCKQCSGSIVLTGGVGGLLALPNVSPYVCALHALSGLTKSLAIDYGRDHIRVNAVLPAATHTPMYKRAHSSYQTQHLTFAAMKNTTPLQKIASVKEIGDLILFLASDTASHISGALVPADGGFSAF